MALQRRLEDQIIGTIDNSKKQVKKKINKKKAKPKEATSKTQVVHY